MRVLILSCDTGEGHNSAGRAVKEFVAARGYGSMSDHTRRNLLHHVWHDLYHHRPNRPFRREEVEAVCLRYWKGER